MDIGSEFDDDFFEKPKEKEESRTSNYEAKVCVPLWYMENKEEGKSTEDALYALKHQADFYYFSKNYLKAVEIYEQCLKLVPPSNNTWKREFMENLSRSYLHLDKTDKALEWSLKLNESSFSPDQKVMSMNLLAIVCHKLGKYKEELEALHHCLQTHKTCPEFWLRLGLCYAGLFKIDLPGYSVLRSNLDDQEPCCAFNTKSACERSEQTDSNMPSSSECAIASSSSSLLCTDDCSNTENETSTLKCEICTLGIQIVSSCLIHTRALLESGGPNPLGSERDEQIKEMIASSLKYMEVDQSFIDIASTMLGTDFLSGRQDSSVLETRECILGKTQVDDK